MNSRQEQLMLLLHNCKCKKKRKAYKKEIKNIQRKNSKNANSILDRFSWGEFKTKSW